MVKKTKVTPIQKSLADAPQYHRYTANDGKSYEVSITDNEIWLSQKDMAQLFGVAVNTVSEHIKRVIADDSLGDSVIRKNRITANDGKSYEVNFYSLKVIVPVGFRLNNSKEATAFRAWATNIIEKYLTIGVVINEPLLESRANLKKQVIVDKHEKAGYGNAPNIAHLRAELEVSKSLKLMNQMIAQVVDNPNYGRLQNAKLEALFGYKSDKIKELLSCKNIHEGLPVMQLDTLDFAHKQIVQILQMQADGRIDNQRAMDAIEMAVKPLGEYLRNLCELLGIHHISGKSLLNSTNR